MTQPSAGVVLQRDAMCHRIQRLLGESRLESALCASLLVIMAACGGGGGGTIAAPSAPAITTQPSSQTVTAGTQVTFTVGSTDSPAPSFQWERSLDGSTWTPIPMATAGTYTFTAAKTDNGVFFHSIAAKGAKSSTSNPATLTVQWGPTFSTQPAGQAVTSPATAAFLVAVDANPAATLQWQSSADGTTWTELPGATGMTYTTGSTSPADSGTQFRAKATNSVNSLASASATLTVNLALAAPVFTTQPQSQTQTGGQSATFTVAATGNPVPNITWEKSTDGGTTWVTIPGATGTTYSVTTATTDSGAQFRARATNSVASAASTAAILAVTQPPPPPVVAPVFTTQPQDQTGTAGLQVTFTAVANGSPAPTFQWESSPDGSSWTAINGATDPTYAFTPQASDNGRRFHVVASNSAGSATSSPVRLALSLLQSFSADTTTVQEGQGISLTAVFADGVATIDHGVGQVVSGTPVLVPVAGPIYTLSLIDGTGHREEQTLEIKIVAAATTIGPEGGTFGTPDGKVLVRIPAGALSQPTALTISKPDPDSAPVFLEEQALTVPYVFEPAGLVFSQTVQVVYYLDQTQAAALAADNDFVFYELADDGVAASVTETPATFSNGALTLALQSFPAATADASGLILSPNALAAPAPRPNRKGAKAKAKSAAQPVTSPFGALIDTVNGVDLRSNGTVGSINANAIQETAGPDNKVKLLQTYQCTNFVQRYYWERYGIDLKYKGDAKGFDQLASLDSDHFEVIDNDGSSLPQPDDILVCKVSACGNHGHTGIVREVDAATGTVYSSSQNMTCSKTVPSGWYGGPLGEAMFKHPQQSDGRMGNWTRSTMRINCWVHYINGAPRSFHVVSTLPAPGAVDVDPGTQVAVTFSQNLDPVASAQGLGLFTASGAPVAGATTFKNGQMLFTPSSPLAASATYTAKLTAAVTSQGGATAVPKQWSFTTKAAVAPGSLIAQVQDAISGLPLSGALISVVSGTRAVTSQSTSAAGSCTLTLAPGLYSLTISKNGYVSDSFANNPVTSGAGATLQTIRLVPDSGVTGNVAGQVYNGIAASKPGIPGVRVELRLGINAPGDTPALATQTADSLGNFTFTNLAPGNYTLSFSLSGYISSAFTITAIGNQTSGTNSYPLVPEIPAGEYRIVLTWGASPLDLDSHLVVPAPPGGTSYEVYYANRGNLTAFPFAMLDVDQTGGWGPETVTVGALQTGTYNYFVRDYSDRGNPASSALSNSGAKVRVYYGAGSQTFNVPVGLAGTRWNVFDIVGGQIVPTQTVVANTTLSTSWDTVQKNP